ncbi:MAG: homoserine dehydrogenase [Victivallales bacterium]|nr:homoserine dehydrogenase [Victivallales bacterium]
MKDFKVGIVGFGNVGSGVVKYLIENDTVIAKRTGVKPILAKIADIDITTDRGVIVPDGILTTDVSELIDEVDVVVELVGGIRSAKKIIMEAISKGKPVVTANKALLAEYGEEIFSAAEKSEADIYYEASVGGGIPIIKVLREGLVGNQIKKITGILNGTCNYILSKMEEEKKSFAEILEKATELGYAEADPGLDVDGFDTAHKAVILASLAYGEWFGMDPVHIEGIRGISLDDIKFAAELGYKAKLLAVIKNENNNVQIRVHPTLVLSDSQMAKVNDVFNAVHIDGIPVGETMFYGKGAGLEATSSSVISDIIDVALNLKFGSHRRIPGFRTGKQFKKLLKMDDIVSRYYCRIHAIDKKGVLAGISETLSYNNISVSSLLQKEKHDGEIVPIIVITHETKEGKVLKAIRELEALNTVEGKIKYIRIEDY